MAAFERVEELVRAACCGRNQKEFADFDQSMMGTHGRDKAGPPTDVING